MTDLTPRSQRTPSRRAKEERAYRLVLASGTAALVTVVSFVLALVGIGGFGIPVIAAIVTIVCVLFFRRTVSG